MMPDKSTRRFCGLLLLGLGVFLYPANAHSQGTNLPTPPTEDPFRAVLSGNIAYVVGETEPIVGPQIITASVSPDGQWVLVLSRRQKGEEILLPLAEHHNDDLTLTLWNRNSRHSLAIWRERQTEQTLSLSDVVWFSDSGHAVISLTRTPRTLPDGTKATESDCRLLVANTATATVRVVGLPDAAFVDVFPSPDRPIATLFVTEKSAETTVPQRHLCLLYPDSRMGTKVNLPEMNYLYVRGWLDQEGLNGLRLDGLKEPSGGKITRVPVRVDIHSGAVTIQNPVSPSVKTIASAPKRTVLRFHTEPVVMAGAVPARSVNTLWLEATDTGENNAPSRAFLAVDALSASLLPGNSGVLFYCQGILSFAPITRLDRAAYIAARNEAIKRRMLSNAKQIASALEQYALDNKGYPPPGSDMRQYIIGPNSYIVSDSGFKNPETGAYAFTYTYRGGPLGPGSDETEIGVLKGPGGRFRITNRDITWMPD